MISNYKRDYIGQTADNYMSFPQTEQSQRLLQKNQNWLANNAARLANSLAAEAEQKVNASGPSGRVDVIV